MTELSHKPLSASRARAIWVRIAVIFFVALILMSVLITYLRTVASTQSPTNASVVSIVTPPSVARESENQLQEPEKIDPSSTPSFIHKSLDKRPSNGDATIMDASDDKVSELEKNVATLTATIAVLQNELQSKSLKLEQTQQANQTTLAVVLAFFQLRDQALSGHTFVSEYQTLLRVSKNMPDHFQEQIRQLEHLATKDVPNADALHEKLHSLEPRALQAIQKESATTWVDRIKVALSSLVSIRRLDDHKTPDVFFPLEQNFVENNLSAVQTAVQNLPPAAQTVLESWKNDVSVRSQINAAIYDMTNDLIEQNLTPNSQQDKKP